MFRFYALRTLKDWIGHVILIGLPITLIYLLTYINAYDTDFWAEAATVISISFIIMFQVFGSAYTHETMHQDFFTAYKDRLLATPVRKNHVIFMILLISTLTSFIQTMFILLFSVVVVGAEFSRYELLIPLLLLSSIISQFIAGYFMVLLKNTSKAEAAITFYAVFGTFMAGVFFEMPSGRVSDFLTRYSTPVAWTRSAALSIIDFTGDDILISFVLLIGTATLLILCMPFVVKKVIR